MSDGDVKGKGKERPILFQGPLVRAILDGRKTQTRRVVNRVSTVGEITEFQRSTTDGYDWQFRDSRLSWNDFRHADFIKFCPFGVVGDRVRLLTTWAVGSAMDYRKPRELDIKCVIGSFWHAGKGEKDAWCGKSRSGRFLARHLRSLMPAVEITEVRVQRLQDISEDDAMAEGIRGFTKDGNLMKYWPCDPCDGPLKCAWADLPKTPQQAFRSLWESINGPDSWASNPWVWALTFKRVEVRP